MQVQQMTSTERFALYQQLGKSPDVQAMALHQRMVDNQAIEQKWAIEIKKITNALDELNRTTKVLAYAENTGLMCSGVSEMVDIRGLIRKSLFDRKLTMERERDQELAAL